MAEINIVIPNETDPGYLRRMMKLAKVQDAIHADNRDRGEMSAGTLQLLLDFVVQMVEVEEGEDAMALLMELSQKEYMAIMDAIGSVEVPKEKSIASNDTTVED